MRASPKRIKRLTPWADLSQSEPIAEIFISAPSFEAIYHRSPTLDSPGRMVLELFLHKPLGTAKHQFRPPVPATAQGNLGRNALRGFAATQWDLTLRRQFHLTEHVSLQARSDFFNILNHPNFGSPINYLTSPQFGHSTQMLNSYLGSGGQSGGLNPLYQIGGPRSIQLALKLQF